MPLTSTPFQPLSKEQLQRLRTALEHNADRGTAVLIDPVDTSFAGETEDVSDAEVVSAIKSVPTHY